MQSALLDSVLLLSVPALICWRPRRTSSSEGGIMDSLLDFAGNALSFVLLILATVLFIGFVTGSVMLFERISAYVSGPAPVVTNRNRATDRAQHHTERISVVVITIMLTLSFWWFPALFNAFNDWLQLRPRKDAVPVKIIERPVIRQFRSVLDPCWNSSTGQIIISLGLMIVIVVYISHSHSGDVAAKRKPIPPPAQPFKRRVDLPPTFTQLADPRKHARTRHEHMHLGAIFKASDGQTTYTNPSGPRLLAFQATKRRRLFYLRPAQLSQAQRARSGLLIHDLQWGCKTAGCIHRKQGVREAHKISTSPGWSHDIGQLGPSSGGSSMVCGCFEGKASPVLATRVTRCY
ncbi:uncharacterized protein L969DRAFT_48268 [Mixia osmundae IAM 14324]|uniref:Uncharacterized protein n=1 Tax=Mixia osmundae (strain CBS 9802 / IAM 14324 / JCM 22182 / KY 12970) TaxID=764103 RepID=G7E9P9_MIXOS|nr:uncharacterized protein L969DRAFT_48268 [Mixia osmundae IAM 14324]KEI39999.1 hypothetical protein L969DRAFT_48268 [Mixia osmundae IAM 14324]GAA99368.1 hypothetical protein E5Q_06064 [Mixia osmundae IAM 14324]